MREWTFGAAVLVLGLAILAGFVLIGIRVVTPMQHRAPPPDFPVQMVP